MFEQDDLNKLYRFCYSLTIDETAAYDVLQNSLEKFLKNNSEKMHKLQILYQT